MFRATFLTASLLSLIVLSALPRLAGADDAAPPAAAAAQSNDYILQPLDLVSIQVFQEEDLTRQVRISQENQVVLPLIGAVETKGLTLRQFENRVRELYGKDYLVNPQVTIVINEYARRTIDIQGQVGNPGQVEFPREEGMTLYKAITRAGGFTRLADKSRVRLTRRFPDGRVETYKIDVNGIIDGSSKELWPLQAEDTIYVPERLF